MQRTDTFGDRETTPLPSSPEPGTNTQDLALPTLCGPHPSWAFFKCFGCDFHTLLLV
jgi:hypothetical protein